jgi:hypothetical protein
MDITPAAQQYQIHPTDPSKTVRVSNSLSPAWESTLVEFLYEH